MISAPGCSAPGRDGGRADCLFLRRLWRARRMRSWSQLALTTALLAALVYSVWYHLRAPVIPEDDAFISYRYVQNLVAGHGPVYNPGERVFGSSTPLYVLWLAVLKWMAPTVDIPVLAVRGNAVFYVATVILMVALVERLTRRSWLALGVGIVAALSPEMLATSVGGMEAFLFVALCVGALYGIATDRYWLGAALAGTSVVVRPEGAFIVGVWAACWFLRKRRDLRQPALASAPLLGWIAFATAYFGTPVPHSVVAKSRPVYVVTVGQSVAQFVTYLIQWGGALAMPFGTVATALSLAVAVTVVALHAILRLNHRRQVAAWAIAVVFLMQVGFYCQPNMQLFPWYMPFIWVFWVLVVVVGFSLLHDWLAENHARLAAVIMALAITIVAAQPIVDGFHLKPPNTPDWLPFVLARQRIYAYQQAAEWVDDLGCASLSIGAPEIGALGYYSTGHIYDACGLVSPQALPYLPVPASERDNGLVGAISTEFVRATMPDCVVTMPCFAEKSIAIDSWFRSQYYLAHTVRTPVTVGDRDISEFAVQVYLRRDVPCTACSGAGL